MYTGKIHAPMSGFRFRAVIKYSIFAVFLWILVAAIITVFRDYQLQKENFVLKDKIQGMVQDGFEKLKNLQNNLYKPATSQEEISNYAEAMFNDKQSVDQDELAEDRKVLERPAEPELILDDGITDEARRYIKELNLINPGHLGAPVVLPGNISQEIQQKVDEGYKLYGFNAFVSSLISLNRDVPENRDSYCKTKVYHSDLPKASVIIPIHDDDWSILMRTIHSIIRYSNLSLIEEIILVDDYSAREHLKDALNENIKVLPMVKVVRSERRNGIVGNRVLGARNAIAPVIVYVDSHVEVTPGWLEPLLDQLRDNKKLLVWTKLAGLDKNTLQLSIDDSPGNIGSFDWYMNFHWIDIAWYEGDHPTERYAPKASPTFMGPTYALWREFFEEIGYFDVDMDIWGGEDVELGFRMWMCGGRVEMVPCSVICHMFRKHTYTMESKGKGGYRWNTDRIAEVWLQDYIRYYYRLVGEKKNFGDISERLEIRNKCKSFQWYLDNVYPMYEIPLEIRDPTTTAPEVQAQNRTQNRTVNGN